MRKRNIVLSLAAAPAVAALLSSCASQNVPGSNLTMHCTDNPDGGGCHKVVDNYQATPATFVLKGTVSPA